MWTDTRPCGGQRTRLCPRSLEEGEGSMSREGRWGPSVECLR